MNSICGATEWEIMIGVSNSTIKNGMWSVETGPASEGGTGTKSADIEVFLPDLSPNAKGFIEPGVAAINDVEVEDPVTKDKQSATIPRVKTVRCQYMGGQNFLIPCIHVNEQVWVLHHVGSSEGWFWLPMGRDKGIRLREHVRWYAMNRKKSISNNDTENVTDDNTYFVDINTNKGQKMIQLHTSRSDDEPVGYDIRIFPEREWLEIVDTYGNYLHLDSHNTIWKMWNRDNSSIELNKKNISIFCDNNLVIGAGHSMKIAVGNKQKQTAVDQVGQGGVYDLSRDTLVNSLTLLTDNNITIRSTNTYALQTTKYTEKAKNNLITAVTVHNGPVTINGAETVNGALTVSSSATIGGDATISGSSYLGHTHLGNMGVPTPRIT